MNSINQAAQGAVAQAATLGGHLTGISGFQTGSQTDLEMARRALRDKINEGCSLACTILRKKIKNTDEADKPLEERKVDRVIYCSDLRQIKNFNKRKNKHEGKITRVKKTSLKDKMHSVKQALVNDDQQSMRDRKSDTSSVFQVPLRGPSSQYGN
jgi:hypothetical protein